MVDFVGEGRPARGGGGPRVVARAGGVGDVDGAGGRAGEGRPARRRTAAAAAAVRMAAAGGGCVRRARGFRLRGLAGARRRREDVVRRGLEIVHQGRAASRASAVVLARRRRDDEDVADADVVRVAPQAGVASQQLVHAHAAARGDVAEGVPRADLVRPARGLLRGGLRRSRAGGRSGVAPRHEVWSSTKACGGGVPTTSRNNNGEPARGREI